MAENTELAKVEPLHIYLRRPEVVEKFIGLFPNDKAANRHIQSVLLLVQTSEPGEYSLMSCSNESILRSALRAASLRVSVDPALRQAWLVPRKNSKTRKVEANLQLHYSEVYNRAMRTNRYWCINVSPVYEGETVLQDVYSGLHQIQLASGLITVPGQQSGFVPVNDRRGKRQGWLGYSKTKHGAESTVYMSTDDIEKFISVANPYWTGSKAWKSNRDVMEQKTVLLALLRKSDLSDPTMEEVKTIVDDIEGHDDDTVDGTLSEVDQQTGEVLKPTADELDRDFPPLAPDWQAAKAAKEEPKKPEPKKPEPKKAEVTRPYPPELFKTKFAEVCAKVEAQNHLDKIGEREQRIVASAIDGIFNGEKTMRYEVCKFLTGHASTKEMAPAQLKTLMLIMGITDYDQAPTTEAMTEIKQAHGAALIAAGHQQLI